MSDSFSGQIPGGFIPSGVFGAGSVGASGIFQIGQEIDLYNVGSPGDTNYERGFIRWGLNEFRVGTEAGGTGTQRAIGFASIRQLFYYNAINTGLDNNGSIYLSLNSTKCIGWSADGNAHSGTYDVQLYRDAAGILAQRNGVNAQAFRVYNTFTDASNNEYLAAAWSGNICTIGTVANGTGTSRAMIVGGGNTLTVATLPAAAASLKGARTIVSDANSVVFNAAAAGGGANIMPVFCNGAGWFIG